MLNKEDIIRMARKADFEAVTNLLYQGFPEDLERFAQLVAAAEREACAKVCEPHDLWGPLAAEVIRARGQQ